MHGMELGQRTICALWQLIRRRNAQVLPDKSEPRREGRKDWHVCSLYAA